jgi:outer membrane murein-binding lipoprotein Lpp
MTDSEKLDLLLEKVQSIEADVNTLKSDVSDLKNDTNDLRNDVNTLKDNVSALKRQLLRSTAELKATDDLILDEVERVHDILDKHKSDTKAHTA